MNVVRLSRLALPGMRAAKWGRIVHITSLVAKQPTPLLTISSTLRAGLSGFTRTAAAIPVGRLGRPEEIGAVIAFLCGSPASYLTGQSLLVDGGLVQGTF